MKQLCKKGFYHFYLCKETSKIASIANASKVFGCELITIFLYVGVMLYFVTAASNLNAKEFAGYTSRYENLRYCANNHECDNITGFILSALPTKTESDALILESSNGKTGFCRCEYDTNYIVTKKGRHAIDYESCGLPEPKELRKPSLLPLTADSKIKGGGYFLSRSDIVHVSPLIPPQFVAERLGLKDCSVSPSCSMSADPSVVCCDQISEIYRAINRDLHNKIAVSSVEADLVYLANEYGRLTKSQAWFGYCDARSAKLNGRYIVDPPGYIKGDIARTLFYLVDHYPFTLTKKQYAQALKWDRKYRVTKEDRLRNRIIYRHQGVGNPYIEVLGNEVLGNDLHNYRRKRLSD